MKVAGAGALLLAGAATALATVAVHQLWWGLVLGTAATAAALVAVGRGWWTRLPFGVGWAALVVAVAPTRAEGDFVISGNAQGFTLLAVAFVVLSVSVATLPRPGRGTPAAR